MTSVASPRALVTAALAAVVLSAACSGSDVPANPAGGGAGAMMPPGSTAGQSGGATIPGAGNSSSGGATPGGGGAPGFPGAGAPPVSGGGASGAPAANAGSGGLPVLPHPNKDHCLKGYDPLPSDNTMMSGPAKFSTSSGDDTILQPEVLQWMAENKWTGAHVVWHAVRGCVDNSARGLLGPLGQRFTTICQDYPVLIPADQNCKTAGDGYQFLLFHRHMMQALQQLWPKHAADFAGFPKFPTTKAELPAIWASADPKWNATILETASIGDNIAMPENLARFPNEGALGHWLQCAPGSAKLAIAPNEPYIGLHFDLHNQWSRGMTSEHGLNNGQVNITNYMFWKLHGWIDNVWEKYRVAKGLTTDPAAMQKYKQDLAAACNEMDIEIEILKQNSGGPVVLDCPPDVDEKGDFHTKVRPLFESDSNKCAGCHGPSQTSPYAELSLGGKISSKCLVERLKAPSKDGGQFKLVEPGEPEKSYLYLKASGTAATAGCVATDPNRPCNTAPMPPGGKTMTDAELKILYDWIKAGAPGPT